MPDKINSFGHDVATKIKQLLNDKKANELLKLPKNIKISLLILIGHSSGKPESYSYKQQDIYKMID